VETDLPTLLLKGDDSRSWPISDRGRRRRSGRVMNAAGGCGFSLRPRRPTPHAPSWSVSACRRAPQHSTSTLGWQKGTRRAYD